MKPETKNTIGIVAGCVVAVIMGVPSWLDYFGIGPDLFRSGIALSISAISPFVLFGAGVLTGWFAHRKLSKENQKKINQLDEQINLYRRRIEKLEAEKETSTSQKIVDVREAIENPKIDFYCLNKAEIQTVEMMFRQDQAVYLDPDIGTVSMLLSKGILESVNSANYIPPNKVQIALNGAVRAQINKDKASFSKAYKDITGEESNI